MQPVMDLCYSRQQVDRREPTPRLSLGDHMRACRKSGPIEPFLSQSKRETEVTE
jgi:hypothetical protein